MQMGKVEVLTIGHSTLPYERFVDLLRRRDVTAVADVRTSPFSRHSPQFNCETLKDELRSDGISYVFLGKELGGRPDDRELYQNGAVDYERMATTEVFRKGVERVIAGAKGHRIALMCSEQDPLDCHRCLLVGRALANRDVEVKHILPDGTIATQIQIEDRLLEITGRNFEDLFASRDERLAAAYKDRARKVAFAEPQPNHQDRIPAE
jgi:uncharacterized protein (DUF488 family)